ncbi:phytanoyl-CoA dioxygenase domain-containing protein 1-like [Tubulanus polymorphus]|uniref:phytanoyl-CoA dioxygenase domain-containing protein 1-like n=1 Tax=Tubulanus polymorphus TaxID=672921 RepID=UPI003DA3866F
MIVKMADGLTDNQKRFFEDNGYLIIEDFLSLKDVDALENEHYKLIEEMNPAEHSAVFSPTHQLDDDYFLNSGDKIRFFFEEDAVNEKGDLVVDKQKSCNKIGHALHWLNPEFKRVTFSDKVQGIARTLGFVRPSVVQSMVIFKQPGIGGVVNPHQDLTYLWNDPPKLIGYWIALEDTTLENGCLWFIPGSHKDGLRNDFRMVRNPDRKSVNEPLLKHTAKQPEFEESKFVPGPVKKGTLVLIDGYVVHKSHKNTSKNSRHIYTFHVTEQHETKWSKDNWLQPTENLGFPCLYDEKW